MKKLFLIALLLPFTALADAPCEHPVFVTQCQFDGLIDELAGQDGEDGQDGQDGADGADGIDGINGIDGRDGIDGADGVVSTAWINETRSWNTKFNSFLAASDAIQIYLPDDKSSRVTFGASRVHGQTGVGIGYAYKAENTFALTLGLGASHGEKTGKVSVGWEF